jgi:hypothetical protein
MKKLFLIILVMFFSGCGVDSKVMVIKKQIPKKPYTAVFLYQDGDVDLAKTYTKNLPSNVGVEMMPKVKNLKQFTAKDRENLKQSLIRSLEASNPFEKLILQEQNHDKKAKADYRITFTFFGAFIEQGLLWETGIYAGYRITDLKTGKDVLKKLELIEGESSATGPLAESKQEAIRLTVEKLLFYVEKME